MPLVRVVSPPAAVTAPVTVAGAVPMAVSVAGTVRPTGHLSVLVLVPLLAAEAGAVAVHLLVPLLLPRNRPRPPTRTGYLPAGDLAGPLPTEKLTRSRSARHSAASGSVRRPDAPRTARAGTVAGLVFRVASGQGPAAEALAGPAAEVTVVAAALARAVRRAGAGSGSDARAAGRLGRRVRGLVCRGHRPIIARTTGAPWSPRPN